LTSYFKLLNYRGFQLSGLESMTSGVPLVESKESGPNEIVADGKSGYLVAAHDIDAFIEKGVKHGKASLIREQTDFKSRKMRKDQ
jgi:glycosyltransferase involved in cell wall biosynthesis